MKNQRFNSAGQFRTTRKLVRSDSSGASRFMRKRLPSEATTYRFLRTTGVRRAADSPSRLIGLAVAFALQPPVYGWTLPAMICFSVAARVGPFDC